MSYGGFYRKEDIPFLKEALMLNYKIDEFLGGRGPHLYDTGSQKEFQYVNDANGNSFVSFTGEEFLFSRILKEIVGRHRYFGMALI